MTAKAEIKPNTTLYPVAVVLITSGDGEGENVFTLNRIASCNAEPPMISISIRTIRASHNLVERNGEFVVNIPRPDMELVGDYVGSVSIRETDKWRESGLTRLPAKHVKPSLIAECPVNLECRVRETVRLPSHSLFIADVLAIHADESVLGKDGLVDFQKTGGGLVYRNAAVREKPVDKFDPNELLDQVHEWRDSQSG